MTDATHPILAEADGQAIPVHPLAESEVEAFLAQKRAPVRTYAAANKFSGKVGQVLAVPGASGAVERVLLGTGSGRVDLSLSTKQFEKKYPPARAEYWGIKFHANNTVTVDWSGRYEYEVDLNAVKTKEDLLNVVSHISGKWTATTGEHIKEFIWHVGQKLGLNIWT